MKWRWQHQAGKGKLLVFCNGWGMDERVVAHLDPGDFDILILSEYSTLELPEEVSIALKVARKRYLLGWSMGVWVGSQILADYDFTAAVACNGTLCPIHDNFGIPPEIFNGTLKCFNQEQRQKFYQRMCRKKELSVFCERMPLRCVENQRAELAFFWSLRHKMQQIPRTNGPWQRAIIANRDMVVLTKHQQDFWTGRLPITEIPGGHYIFTRFPCWSDYFAL